MKTLKQLQEGMVSSSDYKLSKNGKRYKAHRRMIEDTNPYAGILEAMGYEIENKKRLKQIADTAKNAQTKSSETKPLQFSEDTELDEARGRPRKMSMRSHEAGEDESDEHEEHGEDNGVEADQHIHVQLKKAADSDMKPFHVTFKNGKKHPVSQKVAKDILSATERLKPEHRKNVHDEIHHSYDNLMSVHRLVAGK
jgi:hypothetical protein